MAEELLNPAEEMDIEFGSDKKVEEKSEFDIIDEGTYEVVLEKIDPVKTSIKNGKTTRYMTVTFVIRSDVDQKFQKRKIWYTIFGRDGDAAFNFNAINSIIVTQEGRPDYKRHFKSLDEILQYLIGLHLRLDIGVEFNQFKGKDDNVIVDDSFKPSVWDTEEHPVVEKSPVSDSKNLEDLEITDDDLPF